MTKGVRAARPCRSAPASNSRHKQPESQKNIRQKRADSNGDYKDNGLLGEGNVFCLSFKIRQIRHRQREGKMREAIAAPNSMATAVTTAPTALLSAAAALPHLLKNGEATPSRPAPMLTRKRNLWGREDGFTTAGPRRQ